MQSNNLILKSVTNWLTNVEGDSAGNLNVEDSAEKSACKI